MKLKQIWQMVRHGLIWALVTGCVLAAAITGWQVYQERYTASIRISFVYPYIGDGYYPDGERFMMYDFLEGDRVQEALSAMHERGWYEHLTVAQLQQNLSISAYLNNPVQEKVESSRASGSNFSYYSNEYRLIFKQPNPLNIRDASDAFGLFAGQHSREFLHELVRVNMRHFTAHHTDDGASFLALSQLPPFTGMDYADISNALGQKIQDCLTYLSEYEADSGAFVAASTDMSLQDLIIAYRTLRDIHLPRLTGYISAYGITNQSAAQSNRLTYLLERDTLKYNKANSAAQIYAGAAEMYDTTLIKGYAAAASGDEGLHQVQAKTAYDTMITLGLASAMEASGHQENIDRHSGALAMLRNENPAYAGQADGMISDITSKYQDLSARTEQTLREYQQFSNGDYFRTTPEQTEKTPPMRALNFLALWAAASFLLALARWVSKYAAVSGRKAALSRAGFKNKPLKAGAQGKGGAA